MWAPCCGLLVHGEPDETRAAVFTEDGCSLFFLTAQRNFTRWIWRERHSPPAMLDRGLTSARLHPDRPAPSDPPR